jgi:undecaprenyl-diphosphatase
MPIVTHLGDGGILWIALAVILLCIPKYRRTGFAMGIALLMGLLICNLWLKPMVGRLRPFDYQLQCYGRSIPLLIEAPKDFSFPSGHTIASFEAATVLLIHHRKWGILAAILAGLIAFSRLYLYVHYPTDVLFSLALGIGIGFAASYLTEKGFSHFHKT